MQNLKACHRAIPPIPSHQCRVLQPPFHQNDFKNPILAGVHSFSELLFTSRFSTSLSSDSTWVRVDPGTSFTAAKFQVATKSRCQNSRLPKKCFISDGQRWSQCFFQHLCLHIIYQWHIAARCNGAELLRTLERFARGHVFHISVPWLNAHSLILNNVLL